MPDVAEWLTAVAIGIGLAAATGFRVFLPLFIAGAAAHWGALPLADGFQWLSTTAALTALATASVVEVAAYYIPGVDHLLDLLAGPAALVAGVVASASVMVDMPPAVMWPVAIIGGGGIAAVTKVTSALVRAKSGLFTAGLANPLVATAETAGAAVVAVLSIVIPILALVALLIGLIVLGRRRKAPQART